MMRRYGTITNAVITAVFKTIVAFAFCEMPVSSK
jgi:hypothetical protein